MRLFHLPLHDAGPVVERLPIHLPDHQEVNFDTLDNLPEVVQAGAPPTMLTMYFQLNRDDPNARQYLYDDIPTHYTWKANEKKWSPRQSNGPVFLNVPPIGRMYFVGRSQGELPA
jgi:hypothetical protein